MASPKPTGAGKHWDVRSLGFQKPTKIQVLEKPPGAARAVRPWGEPEASLCGRLQGATQGHGVGLVLCGLVLWSMEKSGTQFSFLLPQGECLSPC